MEHMNRKFKKGDSLLRPHQETTLEKNQKAREKRKAMLMKHFNKFAKDMA
jgi:hypothetical protein